MMHAYNRTEADQTDSVAVVGTHEEWKAIVQQLNCHEGYWNAAAVDLENRLLELGVID